MPWIFISFCDNSRGFLVFSRVCMCVRVCVCGGRVYKNKSHESTGPLEWALGLWYRQRKTTSSLVQYQTLHRREQFFQVFLFSQMKAPDNLWFMAFQPSGEFLKVEKTIFIFLNSYMFFSLLYRSWNDNKCQLLHFFNPLYFFRPTSNKRMKSLVIKFKLQKKGRGIQKYLFRKRKIK